jgi:hypothetical protein
VPLLRRLGELLASPRARILVPLAGVLLTLPSLTNGLVLDDVVHRMKARGTFGYGVTSRFDLFSFVSDDPARKAAFYESGFLPWFAPRNLKLSFFRPVSAALHVFDYNVLDRWPWAMHVESVALYAALIALLAVLYRRLLPLGVAMLAALLYAIDDAHGFPVGWLANRNSVVATTFGLVAILAHDRWRRDGWKAGAVLGPLAFTTSLLSAEFGLGSLAYLVAHAVTLDRAPKAKRAWALLPYAAIVIAWQIVYRRLGYGALASGMYADPIADTASFVRAVPEHAAALFLGQLALPPADVMGFAPAAARAAMVAGAVLFAAFVTWVILPKLRADPVTRFFALGMVLAIAPVVASNASDRLLLFIGIGAFGVVAQVIGDLREPAPTSPPPRERSARVLRAFWIGIHLVLAPLLLPVTSSVLGVLGRWVDRVTASVACGPENADKTIILTNLPTIFLGEPWLFPHDPSRVAPRRVRPIASTTGRVSVSREDARTFVVTLAPDATADPLIRLFRDPAHPFLVGEEGTAPGLHATILSLADDGSISSVRYVFDRDLDDPSFRWIGWNGSSLYDTKAPPIGTRVTFGPP